MLQQSSVVKILICAGSNAAVDIVAKRLHNVGVKVVRMFSKRYNIVGSELKHLDPTELALKKDDNLRAKHEQFLNQKMTDQEKHHFQ